VLAVEIDEPIFEFIETAGNLLIKNETAPKIAFNSAEVIIELLLC
jgi:hypothetical protein